MDEHRFDDFPAVIDRQPPDRQSPEAVVSPRTREAHEVFNRELPRPLEERPGQWVAYHGPRRIGFASTKEEIYRACREQGLKDDELLVDCIEPPMGDISFGAEAILDFFSEG